MPDFDISVIKVAQTTEEFHVTADDEKKAKDIAIELAKNTTFDHGDPELVVDMCLECKEDKSA